MIISRRLALADLIELSRVMRHYLGAGLSLLDVFRQQAKRGPLRIRATAGRIAQQLEAGGDLEAALASERDVFPPLMLALASVGEHSGMLPEVFGDLEKYYLQQQQLRRSFLAAAAWPLIQFFLAIFIIAGLIFFLGIIREMNPGGSYDPLGLGLFGVRGAAIFLGVVFGTLLGGYLLYRLAARALGRNGAFAAVLLRVPALGPCLRSLALGRFCMALRLTTETAMPIADALRISLRATDNEAFIGCTALVQGKLRKGRELTLALTKTRLFPEEFLHILAVAEESGRLSEVLQHQAAHYQEESSRRMKALAYVANGAIWLVVGAAIVTVIFKLYSSYLGFLNGI
jgi:type II secretory pathway component PulF